MDWGGRTFLRRCARSPVNETKEAIVGVMYAFGRPVIKREIHQVWGGCKTPSILDYHLRTLIEMGVVEIVGGAELQDGLVDAVEAEARPGFQGGALQEPAVVIRGNGMPEGVPAFGKRTNKR
jgi:hypothetical protein